MLGLENTKSAVENLSQGINNRLDTVQETVQDEDRVGKNDHSVIIRICQKQRTTQMLISWEIYKQIVVY